MRKRIILVNGVFTALALILFSAAQLKRAPRNLEVDTQPGVVSVYIDEGGGSGPVEIIFEPIIKTPIDRFRPGRAFPLIVDMNLTAMTFVDGSALDAPHTDWIRSKLDAGMEVQLHVAQAEIDPRDWRPVGGI